MKYKIFLIINIFLTLNFNLEKVTESVSIEDRTLLSKIYLNGLKRACRFIIYLFLKISYSLNLIYVDLLEDNIDRPIVTLTSFPQRINDLWMVIYSLFNQSVKPAKIILYLTKQEFEQGIDEVPNSLKFFLDKGLHVEFVETNLKSHNKYFYALNTYADRDIITVDDDLLYYEHTIERLMGLHGKYPFAICSNRVLQITFRNQSFDIANNWPTMHASTSPSHLNFALGYSAIFYPKTFRSPHLLHTDVFLALSPSADDLWLKCVEILENVEVVTGEYYAHPLTLPFSQKVALRFSNAESFRPLNDIQLSKLNDKFKLYEKLATYIN